MHNAFKPTGRTLSLAGPDGFRLQETVWSQPQYLANLRRNAGGANCGESHASTPTQYSLNSMASFASAMVLAYTERMHREAGGRVNNI